MMSKEERQEILDLLASGKISVDEAAALLMQAKGNLTEQGLADAIENDSAESVVGGMGEELAAIGSPEEEIITAPKDPPAPAAGEKPTWLRVQVRNLKTDTNKVSINIPVRMLKFGLSIAHRFAPDTGMNWQELQAMLDEGASGLLVDVHDDENHEHVQVYLA